MRFALIVLLICLFSCNTEEVSQGEYEKVAALYSTDIDECERQALKLHNSSHETKDLYSVARFGYLLGVIYSRNEKYGASSDFLNNSLNYFEGIGDEKNIIKCLNVLGYVYKESGNYDFAEKCIKRSLTYSNIEKEALYDLKYRLAEVYFGLGKEDAALKIINDLLHPGASERFNTGLKYSNVGYLYIKGKQYDKAISILNKSISLDNSLDNKANCYSNLSYTYLMKGNQIQALNYANKAIELNRSFSLGDVLRTKALIYIKSNQIQSGINELEKSIQYKSNYKDIVEGYKLASEGYSKLGNEYMALLYAKKSLSFLEKKEFFLNEKNIEAKKVRDAAFKYEHEKQIEAETMAQVYQFIIFTMIIGVILFFVLKEVIKSKQSKSLINKLNKSINF